MASITLEQAWQNKKGAAANVASSQDRVSQLSQELSDANNTLTGAQQADQQAEAVLEGVASSVPAGSVAQTSDGTVLFIMGGRIYEYQLVQASGVSGDDGQVDTGTDTGGTAPATGGTADAGGTTPNPTGPPDAPPATPAADQTPPSSPSETIPGFTG